GSGARRSRGRAPPGSGARGPALLATAGRHRRADLRAGLPTLISAFVPARCDPLHGNAPAENDIPTGQPAGTDVDGPPRRAGVVRRCRGGSDATGRARPGPVPTGMRVAPSRKTGTRP